MASLSISASALAAKLASSAVFKVQPASVAAFSTKDASALRLAPLSARRCAAVTTEVENDAVAAEEEEELEDEFEFTEDGPEPPNAFEIQSLLMELCDETKIAELKVKVGDFSLHVKRNLPGSKKSEAPASLPVPSFSMESYAAPAPAAPPAPAAAAPAAPSAAQKDADEGLVYVTSSRVGLFRRGKMYKGKKGRPQALEGAEVKSGQVLCYLEQLSTFVGIEADVAGEVVKFLVEDGDLVGFGDPVVAIRPSFPGIKP